MHGMAKHLLDGEYETEMPDRESVLDELIALSLLVSAQERCERERDYHQEDGNDNSNNNCHKPGQSVSGTCRSNDDSTVDWPANARFYYSLHCTIPTHPRPDRTGT